MMFNFEQLFWNKKTMGIENLIDDFDQKHLWHPYTSAIDPLPALKVVKAYDNIIELSDGTKLIDAMSSWWCCNLGYSNEHIISALKEQSEHFSHVMFAGFTHDSAINLGKRLLTLLPFMEHIFYADSGSVAAEVSLKMALQYQRAKGHNSRTNFLTIRSGYHGDTWNAMSVCDPDGMHTVFGKAMQQRIFAQNPRSPFPKSIVASKSRSEQVGQESFDPEDLNDIASKMSPHHDEIAAVILEPIVQGAGGMYFYHPDFLKGLRKLCDEHDIVLICDEIATGFGRSGKTFACDYAQIEPDIMLLGKGLTSGYITLSAVLCQKKISHTISQGDPYVFMHGPTFMANPLACAVACAAIDEFLAFQKQHSDAISNIEQTFKQALAPCINCQCVKEVRVLGAIGVVELYERANVQAIEKRCLDLGVWLRPMGNLIYTMPPLNTSLQDITTIAQAINTLCQEIDAGLIASPVRPKNDSLI